MSEQQRLRLQRELQQLFLTVQQQGALALPHILKRLKMRPKDPNLLHLAGLASMAGSEHQQAIKYFKASLTAQANQPEVLNNLANACLKVDLVEEAETYYRRALELKADYVEAWKNLGLLLLSRQYYTDARAALHQADQLNPANPSILTALGNVCRESGAYRVAAEYYRKALAADPNYVNANYNLGLCHKSMEAPDQAIACFNTARRIAPGIPQIDISQGNVLFELGQHEQAERFYQAALEKNPNLVLTHETLSEYYWQLGRHDQIESSYRRALAENPDHTALLESFIRTMIACQQIDIARVLIDTALRRDSTPELLYLRGKLRAQDKDYDRARSDLEKSLEQRFSIDPAHDLVKLHIISGEYELASGRLASALAVEPDHQLSWALQSLCWRLTGDARYAWLIDYERFVRSFTLPTPPGYPSLKAFLAELEGALLDMHKTQHAPSQQTLLHGTQTPGRLLYKPVPVIQAYKQALATVVREYIKALPDDNKHPLLRRKSAHYEFSGSWSVKLQSGGFHVNHVHPQGWISSACYISMPAVTDSDNAQSACIKFGESPLGLGSRESVERVIEPVAGQLVLFPSYTWHGTIDFACPEGQYRLTAPFDVIPTVAQTANDSDTFPV